MLIERSNPANPCVRCLLTFLTLCLLISLTRPAVAQDPAGEPGMADLQPEPVRLEWREVASTSSLFSTPRPVLELRAWSQADEVLDVTVRWRADAGGVDDWLGTLPVQTLAPRGEVSWTFDFDSEGISPSDPMRFAGQILANVSSRLSGQPVDDRVNPPSVVYAPLVFYHRDGGGGWLFYGEEILRDRYQAGDLTGQLPVLDVGRIERATEGGGERVLAAELDEDDRRICMKWQVGVTDGNQWVQTKNGDWIREDFWIPTLGPDDIVPPDYDPTQFTVTARGIRVMLIDGNFQQIYDADPATGCFEFTGTFSDEVTLYAVAYSTDADGNVVNVGTALQSGLHWPFIYPMLIEPPAPGEQLTVLAGDHAPRATLAAIGAFSSYRQNFGVQGKELRIREVGVCGSAGGAASSAHFDASRLPQGIAQLRVHDGTGIASDGTGACSGSDMRRWKFLVGHEMGHAWLLLATGRNAWEPGFDDKLFDATETICLNTAPGYAIGSLEWASVGVREGAAHHYATTVWNRSASPYAAFTWFGGGFEVEGDDEAVPGGRLFNQCTSDNTRCGRSTILDWFRFYWDWHTPYSGDKPSMETIRDVYVATILAGLDDPEREITPKNHYYRIRQTMLEVVASQTQRNAWDSSAHLNGVNTSASADPCIDYYPNCECWWDRSKPIPASCLGQVDCPCADVALDHLYPFQTLGDDGTQPDGLGSYEENGSDGPGQFCTDYPEEAVCGVRSVAGKDVPTCDACGVDSNFGCSCTSDEDCQGLDGEVLSCWGSPADGWNGSAPGICLPSAITEAGRDRLVELPWFCLDNCGSKGSSSRCAFDQLEDIPPGIELDHAKCIDVGVDVPGECEALGQVYSEQLDACVDECQSAQECWDLGFPGTYVCDYEPLGTENGHCVPGPCGNSKVFFDENFEYCQLFW